MNLFKIKRDAQDSIMDASDIKTLEKLRVKHLGRKSEITGVLRSLKDLSLKERKKLGPKANTLKKEIERLLAERVSTLKPKTYHLETKLDVTRPGKKVPRGHLHPLTKIDEEVRRIFTSMNFSVVDGPEVENEYYNFDALNIPADHPAREMHDTFWLRQPEANKRDPHKNLLLRTHISTSQIHYIEENQPPFQFVSLGHVFRYEAIDATHNIQFHYMEGVMVGKDITLANFKFVVEEFFKKFFKGQKITFRFRPSYFPFVEPGLEVDIKLKSNWLEVMGAGMVHRKVFDAARYNPDQVQGFAFGIGLDRLAMIKYNIPDIRLFYSGDLRFIRQF